MVILLDKTNSQEIKIKMLDTTEYMGEIMPVDKPDDHFPICARVFPQVSSKYAIVRRKVVESRCE